MGEASGLIDRDRLVCIGRVSGAHGMEGAIKVVPLTDAPQHYRELRELVLDTAHGLRAVAVETRRDAGSQWVLTLKGLAGRSAAEALKGAAVLVPLTERGPLAENEYFTEDLIGCAVETLSGEALGSVTGVLEAGAQHLLQVAGARGEVLVPLAEAIVKEVLLERRTIRIDPPPGLLELNGR
jgi:16S rRNA processing protein RimM